MSEQEIPAKKILNRKQQAFISEYIKDKNGTQAAIRAGYSKKTACEQAYKLLRKPQIRDEINGLLSEIAEKNKVTAEYVIGSLKEVADRCMQSKPVMVFDPVEKAMVQKTEEDPETGESVGLYEFDSMGANGALKLLGQHLELFTEKHKHEFGDLASRLQKARKRANGPKGV